MRGTGDRAGETASSTVFHQEKMHTYFNLHSLLLLEFSPTKIRVCLVGCCTK